MVRVQQGPPPEDTPPPLPSRRPGSGRRDLRIPLGVAQATDVGPSPSGSSSASSVGSLEEVLSGQIQIDLPQAEVAKVVRRLLGENAQLRDTLVQNNGLIVKQIKVFKDLKSESELLKSGHEHCVRILGNESDATTITELRRQIETLELKVNEKDQAERDLLDERVKTRVLEEKLRVLVSDTEAIPILKAQVELYRDDFNAEREARQKVAREKGDLEEEVRKIRGRCS